MKSTPSNTIESWMKVKLTKRKAAQSSSVAINPLGSYSYFSRYKEHTYVQSTFYQSLIILPLPLSCPNTQSTVIRSLGCWFLYRSDKSISVETTTLVEETNPTPSGRTNPKFRANLGKCSVLVVVVG